MANPFPFPPTPAVNLTEVIAAGTSAQQSRPKANDAWTLGFEGIQNLGAQLALTLVTYLGAGRFVGTDETIGAPTIGTGLTLLQPNATLLVQGRVFIVDNPEPAPYQAILSIAPNKPDGVEVFVGISDETGQLVTKPEWQLDALPVTDAEKAVVVGLLHLGRAVTTASAVTAFTPSTIDGRGIIRPRGTSTGGGGDEGGDPAYAGLLLYLPDDLRPLWQVIQALSNRITDLEAADENTSLGFPSVLDQAFDEIAINRLGLGEVNPPAIERGQISVVGANFGLGQFSTPNYSPTTGDENELPYASGVFG